VARDLHVLTGGPAAALAVASAAALVALAARVTEGWEDAGAVAAQADALRRRATALAAEDAEAVQAYLDAREQADPRQAARDFVLGRALERAADVPLAIAETACDVALLAEAVADRVGGDVRPDAVAGALLAHGAAQAAAHLVAVNLAAGADDERTRRAAELARAAGEAAARIA